MKTYLFIIFQYLLPHHGLSRLIGVLMNSRKPWLKNRLIKWFIKRYQVDMSIAVIQNINDYKTFNDFFTRQIIPAARPFTFNPLNLISPAEGCISQVGGIEQNKILQAKGKVFTLETLFACSKTAKMFNNGRFITVYLSPRDYHRVHMPVSGQLIKMVYVPGRIFSVNPVTTENIPNLFARNERAICLFETEVGPMAVVLVGAMLVASIHTRWQGCVTPAAKSTITAFDYQHTNIFLKQGDELGYFCLGSTVILLFQENSFSWLEKIQPGNSIQVKETLAIFKHKN
ncbi:MAG: phosphatidylserine decarboxylase [Gammaproteobacteria bacterium RIFCSPHIGHO2_12_FULL_35_23]|nr:MAG: phosphatidylserine decarboxylase [Gammaproteobacteria bacterium RIFCSPHIGHO2_12_FULL_35_23]